MEKMDFDFCLNPSFSYFGAVWMDVSPFFDENLMEKWVWCDCGILLAISMLELQREILLASYRILMKIKRIL